MSKQITEFISKCSILKQALYYNRGAKVLQPLQVGDVVRVLPLNRRSKWFKVQLTS